MSVGAISGALLGAAGIGGPPVILYLLSGPAPVGHAREPHPLCRVHLDRRSRDARGERILNAAAMESTLFLAPLYFLGVLLGGPLFLRFSDKRFRQFTLVLLLSVSTFIMLA